MHHRDFEQSASSLLLTSSSSGSLSFSYSGALSVWGLCVYFSLCLVYPGLTADGIFMFSVKILFSLICWSKMCLSEMLVHGFSLFKIYLFSKAGRDRGGVRGREREGEK